MRGRRRAAGELFSNSIRHSGSSAEGETIAVRAAGGVVQVDVADRGGRGVPPQDRNLRRSTRISASLAASLRARSASQPLPEPNIDFAVATLARVAGMVPGAGEAVFAVARTAGWIAHALEAYAGGGPLRPRAVYTGPPAIIDP